jgi:hypothetical protein
MQKAERCRSAFENLETSNRESRDYSVIQRSEFDVGRSILS